MIANANETPPTTKETPITAVVTKTEKEEVIDRERGGENEKPNTRVVTTTTTNNEGNAPCPSSHGTSPCPTFDSMNSKPALLRRIYAYGDVGLWVEVKSEVCGGKF
jgi:hypothetical protein